eukprot:TRINITY_DN799_c0_g1_i1.p1 TRINITY_DN799_c0_g1~~TRINITY_DN799_c0_g1_i1.p1  ORF type:complete len:206 (+),score=13.90 TRINITY_DN799_c0_g1_i1:109-726(+)
MGAIYENVATLLMVINLGLFVASFILPWFVVVKTDIAGCESFDYYAWTNFNRDCRSCNLCSTVSYNWQTTAPCSDGKCTHLIPIFLSALGCYSVAALAHLVFIIMMILYVCGKIGTRGWIATLVSALFCAIAVIIIAVGLPIAGKTDNYSYCSSTGASPCDSFIGNSGSGRWGPWLGWIFAVSQIGLSIITAICLKCASDWGSRV